MRQQIIHTKEELESYGYQFKESQSGFWIVNKFGRVFGKIIKQECTIYEWVMPLLVEFANEDWNFLHYVHDMWGERKVRYFEDFAEGQGIYNDLNKVLSELPDDETLIIHEALKRKAELVNRLYGKRIEYRIEPPTWEFVDISKLKEAE